MPKFIETDKYKHYESTHHLDDALFIILLVIDVICTYQRERRHGNHLKFWNQ